MSGRRPLIAGLLLLLAAGSAAAGGQVTALDEFARPGLWAPIASDDVAASAVPVAGAGLRLEFDFRGHAGFAGAERALALDLPANFEIDLALEGELGANDLEFKLVDDSGDNVWWYRRVKFELPNGATVLRIRRRQIDFAWGPTADKMLKHVAHLQLVVNGSTGGKGWLQISSIRLVPLPVPPAVPAPPTASAAGIKVAVPDGAEAHDWRCSGPERCALTLDWQGPREFGGMRLAWQRGGRPARYALELSDDGEAWRAVREVEADGAGADWLWLPDSEARYARLSAKSAGRTIALHELKLMEPAFGDELNALIAAAAAERPRGTFFRGATEQAYWTLVGVDDGRHSGLLSEDGQLETDVGGPSVEPFVVEDGTLASWATVTPQPSLPEGYLPLPSVAWATPHWRLTVSAFADPAGQGRLYGRYTLKNLTGKPKRLSLLLALRPFQVNPPAQFLNTVGGVARIHKIRWDGTALVTDRGAVVMPLSAPDRVALHNFDSQALPARLATLAGTPASQPLELEDPSELASAVLAFDLELPANGERTLGVVVPWGAGEATAPLGNLATLLAAERRVSADWKQRLNLVQISAPDAPRATALSLALRSAHAHLLMSRQGGLLRPGTRSYARSWIRDGAMMSAALLRLGERQAPEEYLRAYSGFLFTSGKVPCCVDARGADPVPEHDSAGEFLYLAGELWRLGGDQSFLASVWPKIRAAADYLDTLRRTARDTAGTEPRFLGLLPPSISHEGYSAKPMHSYWDDFWGLRGYSDAIGLAQALGHTEEAARWTRARAQFSADIAASIALVTRERGIDFIPGAADLGDFDATSTTVALAPGTGAADLPRALLAQTFERYWQEFAARRAGQHPWEVYTPYEWRVVGAFVRLGERERALEALDYFMADRRPAAWNQWPEVIGREPRRARFIGDLPHGWVASDFIRSALALFAYEDEASGAIVLAAGIPRDWLAGRGVTVHGLRTRYGRVNYSVRAVPGGIDFELHRGSGTPPGGFLLQLPNSSAGTVLIDGRSQTYSGGVIRLRSGPARVHLHGG